MKMERDLRKEYEELINSSKVFLFMKGYPDEPFCGFSMRVVRVLQEVGVEDFDSFNILEDNEMREAIKEFSDWPTFPQLYVYGKFVGGCEIVEELFREDELEEVLNS